VRGCTSIYIGAVQPYDATEVETDARPQKAERLNHCIAPSPRVFENGGTSNGRGRRGMMGSAADRSSRKDSDLPGG
jgi:hypothetical protein